jgi:anhydro-N-acetylmuramic acid kinase
VSAGDDARCWIGLISGTSADGIDAALLRLAPQLQVLATLTHPYPAELREQVLAVSQQDHALSADDWGRLDHRIAASFADAALQLMAIGQIDAEAIAAIGSHGQTLRHRPRDRFPFTLQLGDPSLIAERSGCTVVADFRRRDVAAGGEGAPLLPLLHAALLRDPNETRAVLNLGGIGNLTLLPRNGVVRGFDTGPANCLLDAWVLRHLNRPFDRDGAWAAEGRSIPGLLARLLDEPWFALPPPKSTGREVFHLDWLAARAADLAAHSPADVQATLLQLTAHTVAAALRREQPDTTRLLVCGGGAHNPPLLAALAALLPGCAVESVATQGLDPDFVEAAGFAWLARETLAGRPGNLPSVTGARGLRVLGGIYPA